MHALINSLCLIFVHTQVSERYEAYSVITMFRELFKTPYVDKIIVTEVTVTD